MVRDCPTRWLSSLQAIDRVMATRRNDTQTQPHDLQSMSHSFKRPAIVKFNQGVMKNDKAASISNKPVL
jgi:hypothetical protein